ncbi:MAG: hypothetical protein WA997_14340 [Anaerolineales bacterium]|nr:hypothetical protein [Anaerolineales bacterium]
MRRRPEASLTRGLSPGMSVVFALRETKAPVCVLSWCESLPDALLHSCWQASIMAKRDF